MASRGTYAKKEEYTTDEYITVENVEDAKVLKGKTKQIHSLPDYSHSPGAVYIKYESDGKFREMRFYNDNHEAILEIAYHPEPQISVSGKDRKNPILHYHLITPGKNFKRNNPLILDKNNAYYYLAEKYLRRYGL